VAELEGAQSISILHVKMLRLALVNGSRSKALLPSLAARFGTSNTDDINRFVADVLTSKKFAKQDIESELARLEKGNVKTMDLLRKLNIHDWDQLGVSVGAARAISDALFELKHNEMLQKTEMKMKLRRENSSKQESRQKRL
jgi:hypothetical protein